jgi:hypothetical protein
LKTHQRREGLKDMKEEELVKFNFALPYIFLPRAQEEPTSEDSVVNVVTEVNGKGATFEFDWEMDEVDVRVPSSPSTAHARFRSGH